MGQFLSKFKIQMNRRRRAAIEKERASPSISFDRLWSLDTNSDHTDLAEHRGSHRFERASPSISLDRLWSLDTNSDHTDLAEHPGSHRFESAELPPRVTEEECSFPVARGSHDRDAQVGAAQAKIETETWKRRALDLEATLDDAGLKSQWLLLGAGLGFIGYLAYYWTVPPRELRLLQAYFTGLAF